MYSQEELAFQKRFAFGQLLLNGITTAAPIASLFYREWGETVAEFDAAADAAGELGLRVYLSPAYRSGGMVLEKPGQIVPVFDEERGLQGLKEAVSYIERQNGRHGDLVRGMLAPDRVETSTLSLLQRTDAAARDLDVKFRLHMAQGAMEVDTVRALHGSTAPVWLAKAGLLSDRLIAPHATNATEEDLALYAENAVSIVHCPLVSGRGGSTLNSFSACRKRGINIAMGTDTAPADMLMNLLVGLITCRANDHAPDQVRSADFYDAATLGGARALGRADIGHLSPGARADIVVFDLDDTIMAPSIDPISDSGDRRFRQGHPRGLRRRPCFHVGPQACGHRHGKGARRGAGAVRSVDRQISGAKLEQSAGVRNLPAKLSNRGGRPWVKQKRRSSTSAISRLSFQAAVAL